MFDDKLNVLINFFFTYWEYRKWINQPINLLSVFLNSSTSSLSSSLCVPDVIDRSDATDFSDATEIIEAGRLPVALVIISGPISIDTGRLPPGDIPLLVPPISDSLICNSRDCDWAIWGSGDLVAALSGDWIAGEGVGVTSSWEPEVGRGDVTSGIMARYMRTWSLSFLSLISRRCCSSSRSRTEACVAKIYK